MGVVVVGSAFIILRLPGELDASNRFDDWPDVVAAAEGTPVDGLDTAGFASPPSPEPLGRRARINVGLVQFTSQSIQILLVTALLWAFYLVFGMFTVIPSTIEQWTGSTDLDTWFSFGFGAGFGGFLPCCFAVIISISAFS